MKGKANTNHRKKGRNPHCKGADVRVLADRLLGVGMTCFQQTVEILFFLRRKNNFITEANRIMISSVRKRLTQITCLE
jgi:hypothetical protein